MAYQEGVAVLRKYRRLKGHRILRLVNQAVGGVAEQPVTGVVPRDLSDVELLLLSVEVPEPVLHPVCPGGERDAGGPGRNFGVAVRLCELHTGPAVEPEAGRQLGDHGQGIGPPDLVLTSRGVSLKTGGSARVRGCTRSHEHHRTGG